MKLFVYAGDCLARTYRGAAMSVPYIKEQQKPRLADRQHFKDWNRLALEGSTLCYMNNPGFPHPHHERKLSSQAPPSHPRGPACFRLVI